LAELGRNHGRVTVQLPLTFERRDGQTSTTRAWLGFGSGARIELMVDDSAMGISLADRLREHGDEARCQAWVEGEIVDAEPGVTLRALRVVRAAEVTERDGALFTRVAVPSGSSTAFIEAVEDLGSAGSEPLGGEDAVEAR